MDGEDEVDELFAVLGTTFFEDGLSRGSCRRAKTLDLQCQARGDERGKFDLNAKISTLQLMFWQSDMFAGSFERVCLVIKIPHALEKDESRRLASV